MHSDSILICKPVSGWWASVSAEVVHRFAQLPSGETVELTARNPGVDYKPVYAYHLEVRSRLFDKC